MAQMIKKPPAMWETWVRTLDWEDPLEKGTAAYSSILTWRIPWTEEPGGLRSVGLQRVGQNSDFHICVSCLQCMSLLALCVILNFLFAILT